MRCLFVIAAAFLVACSPAAPQHAPLSSDELIASLEASGLPADEITAFDETTDPNNLLGRPGQYIAKVSWTIHLEPTTHRSEIDGRVVEFETPLAAQATVEVFPDLESLESRFAYTEALAKTGGMFAQYIYVNEDRLALLRVTHQVTPDKAATYEEWLADF